MPQRAPLLEISEIVRMLAARIQTLAPDLLPGGQRRGAEWVCGSPAGEAGTQMAVHLTGAKAGVWAHFAGSERGDALDLVAACRTNGHRGEALKWARAWLGLDTGRPPDSAPPRPAPDALQADAEALAETQRKRANAQRIWLAGQRQLIGTPVDWYLQGRGIALADLKRQPGAIRFHPELYHLDSARHWPAMVTAISGPEGMLAVHRTWLEVIGSTARKAPVDNNKMTFGGYRGGHIPLARGVSGKPLREAAPGETLDITEGIEDGLTVAVYAPDFRVIAAISVANLQSIALPPQIHTLRIWRQNDTKRAAIEAFERAVTAHQQAGRAVVIPKIPAGLKDINDMFAAAE